MKTYLVVLPPQIANAGTYFQALLEQLHEALPNQPWAFELAVFGQNIGTIQFINLQDLTLGNPVKLNLSLI